MIEQCPGASDIRTPTITLKDCPECGEEVEIFSNEMQVKCSNCGFTIYNDVEVCIQWCKYAEECVGEELYKKLKRSDGEMVITKRKIIKIDDEKCDGCGLCIPSCPEGALQIVDGKARIVKENFCDGLGACLGDCPQGALTIEEKEVEEYDEEGVIAHIKETSPDLLERHLAHLKEHAHELTQPHSHEEVCSCPSLQIMAWENGGESSEIPRIAPELTQWPIQLHLVPPRAPYFQHADLVLVVDCVPFAYADFHRDFLKDKAIAICCPKLDDTSTYVGKITQILRDADVGSLKVLHMEVPCCFGLVHIAHQALAQSGKDIPFESVEIGIKGEISS